MTKKQKRNREIRLKKWMKGKELPREKLRSLLHLRVKGKTNLDWKNKKISGEITAIGSDMVFLSNVSFHRNELEFLTLTWDE